MTPKISRASTTPAAAFSSESPQEARFVLPRSARWPHQSVSGDVMQFISCNAGWKSLLTAPAAPAWNKQWESVSVWEKDGWARHVLAWLHGGVPASENWVSPVGTPHPLEWQWRPEYKQFRYCPACVCVAYHSPLHQYPWVTHCFVHPGQPILAKSINRQHNCGTPALLWAHVYLAAGAEFRVASAARGKLPAAAQRLARRYQEMVAASREINWIVEARHRTPRTSHDDVKNIIGDMVIPDRQSLLGPDVDEHLLPELAGIVHAIACDAGFADVAEMCRGSPEAKRQVRVFTEKRRRRLAASAIEALNPTTAAVIEWLVADAAHYGLDPEQFSTRLQNGLHSPKQLQVPPSEEHDRRLQHAELELMVSEMLPLLRSRQVCTNAEDALAGQSGVSSTTCAVCTTLATWRHTAFGSPAEFVSDRNAAWSFEIPSAMRLAIPLPAGGTTDQIRRYRFRLESIHYLVRGLRRRVGGPSCATKHPRRFQRALIRVRGARQCVIYSWDTDDLEDELLRFLDHFAGDRCLPVTG